MLIPWARRGVWRVAEASRLASLVRTTLATGQGVLPLGPVGDGECMEVTVCDAPQGRRALQGVLNRKPGGLVAAGARRRLPFVSPRIPPQSVPTRKKGLVTGLPGQGEEITRIYSPQRPPKTASGPICE